MISDTYMRDEQETDFLHLLRVVIPISEIFFFWESVIKQILHVFYYYSPFHRMFWR